MKILVNRSGGFAGIKETIVDVDTSLLTPESASIIEKMVKSIDFFNLPDNMSPESLGADLIHYEITITEGTHYHRVEYTEENNSFSSPLGRLIETLIQTG